MLGLRRNKVTIELTFVEHKDCPLCGASGINIWVAADGTHGNVSCTNAVCTMYTTFRRVNERLSGIDGILAWNFEVNKVHEEANKHEQRT